MKPVDFDYFDPATVDEALALLANHGDDGKALAGGQSLVPLLNLRLARPKVLVDLNRIASLAYVRERNGGLAIGAMTRQRVVETSDLVRSRCPLLAEATTLIGHPTIRNRGTVGGSLAHADPASELPAALLALGGEVAARSRAGERVIPAKEFFRGHLTTALRPGELLAEIRLPAMPAGAGWAFEELARRHGDFAVVGVAAVVVPDGSGRVKSAALALIGVGGAAFRAAQAEQALVGRSLDDGAMRDAGRLAAQAARPESDVHAPAEYRTAMVEVFVRRALGRAWSRIKGVGA